MLKMWLFANCSSKLFNPKLAEIFFKSGMIEAWGRGFDKISEACAKNNSPLPEYTIDGSGIMVCCNAGEYYIRLLNGTCAARLMGRFLNCIYGNSTIVKSTM